MMIMKSFYGVLLFLFLKIIDFILGMFIKINIICFCLFKYLYSVISYFGIDSIFYFFSVFYVYFVFLFFVDL